MEPLRPKTAENHRFARREEPWTSRAVAFVAFVCAFEYGVYRIGLGLDLADEGLYVAAPLRYALGDTPFRDEFLNPWRMFDIVLWPLFHFVPGITLFQLRLLWLVVQTGAAIALYTLLVRFAPGWLVALACIATLYLPNLIWTPGYHLMGSFLFVLGWSLWLMASLSRRVGFGRALGATSGVVFFLGALSYLPLLAVVLAPAGVLAHACAPARESGAARAARLRATAAHLGALLVCTLAALGTLAYAGLAQDWLAAHRIMLSASNYSASGAEKLSGFFMQGAPFLPLTLLVGAALGALGRAKSIARLTAAPMGSAVLAFSVLAFLLALHFELPLPGSSAGKHPAAFKADSLRVMAGVLGLHLGAFIARRPRRGAADDADWRFVYSVLVSGSLLLAFLLGLLGDMAWKSMFAVVPLFASAIVALDRSWIDVRLGAAVGAASCFAFGIASYAARSDVVYGEASVGQLTAEFSHPRLAGIRSTSAKVEHLEAVARYLEARVEEGDRLLVVGHAPFLHYLLRTRPALDHSWNSGQVPARIRQRSLQKMIAAGRVPEYAVRDAAFAPTRARLRDEAIRAASPIHGFVFERYRLERSFGPFEVWKLRRGQGRADREQ